MINARHLPYRLRYMRETITLKQLDKAVIDLADELRAFKYHTGDQLDQRRAGTDLGVGIVG